MPVAGTRRGGGTLGGLEGRGGGGGSGDFERVVGSLEPPRDGGRLLIASCNLSSCLMC